MFLFNWMQTETEIFHMLKASFYVSTKTIAFLAQGRPETRALYTLQVQKAKRSKMPSQKFTELANG